MSASRVVLLFSLASAVSGCIQHLDDWKQVSVEERARRAQIVFHGLAIESYSDSTPDSYSAYFWIINVYKGAEALAQHLHLAPGNSGVVNLRDRRVNVTQFGDKSQCISRITPQNYYIVFAELQGSELVAKYDDVFGAAVDWSPETEQRVWTGVGWDPWSDWSPCSASCGEGTQERRRFCRQGASCHGYNKERRRCNTFSCEGAVSPLDIEDKRYFHPSRAQWEHVPGRPTAWRLRPNSYIWVPSSELFPSAGASHTGNFPREFSLLVTLRFHPQGRAQGTVFSLRSRRQQDAYLSLELAGPDHVKLVHAGPNGTQTVDIPASLEDGNWHQLALGLHDDSSVRSYLDCEWMSTEILKRNALDIPGDADVVIGYLFMGDLEQLAIVPNPTAVSQQCSGLVTPMVDNTLFTVSRRGRRTKGRKGVEPIEKFADEEEDEDLYEGSGSEGSTLGDPQYEVEWSEWSDCSVTCGTGSQSRYSRCVDDGSRLELCMEAGGEHTETRTCSREPCVTTENTADIPEMFYPSLQNKHRKLHHRKSNNTLQNSTVHEFNVDGSGTKPCSCLNGGLCHMKRRTCHCPPGYFGRRCERASCRHGCLNGGHCREPDRCVCPPHYTGDHCQTPICEPPCLNGGVCLRPGVCSCPAGYLQPRCSPVCDPPCRYGGHCIKPHVCHCPAGTSGSYCQNFSCRFACLNGGACVGPDQCECPRNATGSTCADPVCDPPCENGATCSSGNRCLCEPGTSGTRCEKRKCEYRPYQEPYTRGFRRLVSRRVETKCEPWGWKTCVHNQPEYQTVYKTFYRTVYKCADTHH